ncbi:Opaque-specific ABC transporter CDR3 like protein [Verticillium longisporum]|uniref:Opaque-specific ABC transporter CDR3 like protein n=1 Tax=Verticillium longisporum TaxID=100787 RepID=A0A8I3AI78_VERLO|nr:Opaque-specific ABC transporter CDR3 like protein [Verticillium longisporum]
MDHGTSSRGSLNTLADTGGSTDNPDGADEQIRHDMIQLARRLTTQSHVSGPPAALFPLLQDSPLDPNSDRFNAKQWAKAFFSARKESLQGNVPKTTGVAFRDLNVYGFGSDTDFQKSVGNIFLEGVNLASKLFNRKQQRIDILRDLEGVVHSGEMLCVLGPPGSGCSTFLKTVAGETHGFHVQDTSTLNYSGIHPDEIRTAFRGEAIYTAEVDHHFPQLTVGDTLYFAAAARCPKNVPAGISRHEYIEHLRDVTMAMFGISHTKNTRVGDDFVRGVSGGERKRVTIAEASLSYSPLQCWDNSTRGLDSANAIEFCRTLRTQADVMGCTSCVAIYQAPQTAYDLFDKVLVLYEGRQIFFGKTSRAQAYFEELGFICPDQQTTADFLTSMTSSDERVICPGWENKTPRTPDEFSKAWKESRDRAELLEDVEDYLVRHPFHGDHYNKFIESRRLDQASTQRAKSPFTLSYLQQMNLTSVLEIVSLYAKRKIIEKHARYALYHPSAEALSSMVVDLPYKLFNAVITNVTVYFMANLHREPGNFFFFLLVAFTVVLTMSMLFRLIASVTKSIAQAMAPSAIILLCLILYTGFTIPVDYMKNWIKWSRWGNPIFYGLESIMINEFNGRAFPCTTYVPSGTGYDNVPPSAKACSAQGSVAGQDFVDGAAYLSTAYSYDMSHKWRNWGVVVAFGVLYFGLHLLATEYVASQRSKGEVLVYLRKAMKQLKKAPRDLETASPTTTALQHVANSSGAAAVDKQTSVFHWGGVSYDVRIKSETRRILDHVDGWVKPGTLTALMGSSGAGKTTLLDVLASRVTTGVVTGDMLVNGSPRDESFQRKTGYVQQQDLHLPTSTVREALRFSALLRQPSQYTQQEKIDYVDTVIELLSMEGYADAIIGVPGEGLNVEQRETIYFGDIGKGSRTLMDYFARNGAHALPEKANPAEYMLEVIGAAPGAKTDVDWPAVWKNSPEYQHVQNELARLAGLATTAQVAQTGLVREQFSVSFLTQFTQVTKRVFQQYWRSPGYIYAKALLSLGGSLFVGLSFLDSQNTKRGMSNQMFGIFMFLSLFPNLVNQIMPVFASQRVMYESRERPSKAYGWPSFVAANVLVELAWNSFMSIFAFIFFYYPMNLSNNAEWTDTVHIRSFLMFLHLWMFFAFTSTFAHMMIAGLPTADHAGGLANLLLIMMFTFCGVIAGPDSLPGFWIFMYRVNPFTYVIESLMATGLGDAPMHCAPNEFITFTAPDGSTCAQYASEYLAQNGGYLENPDSSNCSYCSMSNTNEYLASVSVSFGNRWRDFGIMWAFCMFNISMAFLLYWLARVPKKQKAKKG